MPTIMRGLLIVVAWNLTTAAHSEETARARDRPNILFAISDDQSYPHAGILGDPVAKTPAFDRVRGRACYLPTRLPRVHRVLLRGRQS